MPHPILCVNQGLGREVSFPSMNPILHMTSFSPDFMALFSNFVFVVHEHLPIKYRPFYYHLLKTCLSNDKDVIFVFYGDRSCMNCSLLGATLSVSGAVSRAVLTLPL